MSTQDILHQCCDRHGSEHVLRALRDYARSIILQISLSGASEDRIAERCAPWQATCDQLRDL